MASTPDTPEAVERLAALLSGLPSDKVATSPWLMDTVAALRAYAQVLRSLTALQALLDREATRPRKVAHTAPDPARLSYQAGRDEAYDRVRRLLHGGAA